MNGLKRSLLAASFLGLLMTGCSAGSSVFQTVPESMPESLGGLPAGAPAAPKTPYPFPAVHDMPPQRSAKPLSDDQQIKLERDLEAARDRQLHKAGDDPDADPERRRKKPAAVTKKKPVAAKNRPDAAAQAGAKTNP